MKKILFASLIFISACSHLKSKQQRVEDLVNNYLDSALNSPNNYESRMFSNVTPVYATYVSNEPDGWKLLKLELKYGDSDLYYLIRRKNRVIAKYYKLKGDSIQNMLKLKQKNYKGKLLSYYIAHTYKAKDTSGIWTLQVASFTLDTGITKIISVSKGLN